MSSLHRGELVPLVYVEAADSSSIQMRECINIHGEESAPLLSVEEADSFSVRECECFL